MKIQKRYWFVIFSLILFFLFVEVVDYVKIAKQIDLASATSIIPNPGHAWSEIECNSDSLCVDTINNRLGIGTASPNEKLEVSGNIKLSGVTPTYKVTNVAAPTATSDVATKAYVDAASGSSYGTCYLINDASSGVSCSAGYISLVSVDSIGRFAFDSSLSSVIFSPVSTFFVGIGGGLMEIKTSYTGTGYIYPIYWYHWQGDWLANSGTGVTVTTCSDANVAGKVNLTLNGTTYTSIVACNNGNNGIVYMPVSLALCCK
jgi:hypothetical protein